MGQLARADSRSATRSHRSVCYEVAAIGLASACLLIALQIFLQNAHIATTNGLAKSIDVRRWMERPSWQLLDDANVLYFPAQALLCRLLAALEPCK